MASKKVTRMSFNLIVIQKVPMSFVHRWVNLQFRSRAGNMEVLSAVCCILLIWQWHKSKDIRWNTSQHSLPCQYSEKWKSPCIKVVCVCSCLTIFFKGGKQQSWWVHNKSRCNQFKKSTWLLSASYLKKEEAINSYLQLLSENWICLLLQNGCSHP